MSNIAVFGAGDYYHRYIDFIKEKENVECILDNNKELWDKTVDNTLVVAPQSVFCYQIEYIILLVTVSIAYVIKKQLIEIGVHKDKILLYDEYFEKCRAGEYKIYYPFQKNDILIASSHLHYDGGSMAVYHAAVALTNQEYKVTLVVSCANNKLISEMVDKGIEIVVYPAIMRPTIKEINWMNQFRYIVCSDEFMITCVKRLNYERNVVWWLHGPNEVYDGILKCFGKIYQEEIENVRIYAVSSVAKRNFINAFGKHEIGILPYGTRDRVKKLVKKRESNRIVFAIIAGFCKLKAQDIFLEAAKLLNDSYGERVEYWLIGHHGENHFAKQIMQMASEIPNVKIKGVLTREAIDEAYRKIDVVVCPSWEECLPTVIVEGMMYKKIGIVSDNTGLIDYITDGVNGCICKTGDVHSLYEKMKWIVNCFYELDEMRENARALYERFFSIRALEERLVDVLLEG